MCYTTHAYSHFVIKAYELYVVLVIFDKEKNLLLYNIYFKVILLRNQKVVTWGVKTLIIILVWIRIATIFKCLVLRYHCLGRINRSSLVGRGVSLRMGLDTSKD